MSFLLLAGLLWTHRAEITNVWATLTVGLWRYFAAALALQMVFYCFQALMYKVILSIWNVNIPYAGTYLITLVSNAWNKLVPSGGASGAVSFAGEAARYGVGTEVSLLANISFYLLDYLSFFPLVMWGLYYLFVRGDLNYAEEVAAAMFGALVLLALILFAVSAKNIGGLAVYLEKFKPRQSTLARFKNAVSSFLNSCRSLDRGWEKAGGKIAVALLCGILMQFTDMAVLYLSFKTANYSISPGLVAAGFGLVTVMSMASMVPQGIGVYETAMTWFYMQMGVSFGTAFSVALIYRGATFWYPIIPGMIGMRLTGRHLK
ncbi:MAG: lysylphosphatidylglycerol synthase transmembrane domain-containing protein [Bacillota bacterium]